MILIYMANLSKLLISTEFRCYKRQNHLTLCLSIPVSSATRYLRITFSRKLCLVPLRDYVLEQLFRQVKKLYDML